MSLKIGIIGLPNVGKSTLFKTLTQQQVDIANYPFATIEPNVGVVPVPDARLEQLASLSHSKKVIPAVVEFVDIAGLVKGAAEGEGLGNKFLTHIREVDALAEVVRVFEDPEIIHVSGKADPLSDIGILEYELILKDLETVLRRLESLEGEMRGGKKTAAGEKAALEGVRGELEAGRFAPDEIAPKELQLLTSKKIIYIFNASEKQIQEKWQPAQAFKEKIGSNPYVIISAKIESELNELPVEERKEYMASLDFKESGLDRLIRTGYQALGLITFFTTGEDEARAWTVPRGSIAPRAGRAIHSDFEEKFIRVEVINWEKLIKTGSWSKARELGAIRTEGKEYMIEDGDVVEFKI